MVALLTALVVLIAEVTLFLVLVPVALVLLCVVMTPPEIVE
jgi:hypothetical protein